MHDLAAALDAYSPLRSNIDADDIFYFSYTCWWSDTEFRQPAYTSDDTRAYNGTFGSSTRGEMLVLGHYLDYMINSLPHSRVVLVGHSMGGVLGAWWAARSADEQPDNRIILLATIDSPLRGSDLVDYIPSVGKVNYGLRRDGFVIRAIERVYDNVRLITYSLDMDAVVPPSDARLDRAWRPHQNLASATSNGRVRWGHRSVVRHPDLINSLPRFVLEAVNESGHAVENPPREAGCSDEPGVYLYQHRDYRGKCVRINTDIDQLDTTRLGGDSASSIRIIGSWTAYLYADSRYRGAFSRFTSSDPSLDDDAVANDRASSVKVGRGNMTLDPTSVPSCGSGEGVYLYEHPNFRGQCLKLSADEPRLNRTADGGDRTSSVKIVGSWTVRLYAHDDYQGEFTTLQGDDADLGDTEVGNDHASSIKVRRGHVDITEPPPPPCGSGDGVYIFEHRNFGGRCYQLRADEPRLNQTPDGGDRASSIRIIGPWEATLYAHDDYQGEHSTFTTDDQNLDDDAVGNDHASSVKVRRR
jgi:hypothetical protein